MKRFLFKGMCFGVTVLFSVCGIAVLVGRQQAEPTIIKQLRPCGEMLCYLGILPGVTTWDEGINLVKQAPQLKNSNVSESLFFSAEPRYSVGFASSLNGDADPNQGLVEQLTISFDEENIYAGDVIQKLGPPCFVEPWNGGLAFGYRNAIIVIKSDDDRLTPMSLVRQIVLKLPNTSAYCPEAWFSGPLVIYRWNGFRRYPHF